MKLNRLDYDTDALELIKQTLEKNRLRNNVRESISAFERLGDLYTGSIISEHGLNVDKFTTLEQSRSAENGTFIPFVGSLYSRYNWKKFTEQLDIIKKHLTDKHQDGVKPLTWLAPSEGMWGRNNYLQGCFQSLIDSAKNDR